VKEFFSFLGKLIGIVGKGSKLWGQGLALLPHLVQIMMAVQMLHGPGTGAEKRALAIKLFRELLAAEGHLAKPLSPELAAVLENAIGACVDAGMALDKVIATIKAE
jgi:hypothetical protein